MEHTKTVMSVFLPLAPRFKSGPGRLIVEVVRTHTQTHTHTNTHTHTHTRQDSSERMISPLHRQQPSLHPTTTRCELPCTQQETYSYLDKQFRFRNISFISYSVCV